MVAGADTEKACPVKNPMKASRKKKISAAFSQFQHTQTPSHMGTEMSILWTATPAEKQKPSKVAVAIWCPESFPAHHGKTFPSVKAFLVPLQRGEGPRPGWTHHPGPEGEQQSQTSISLAKPQLTSYIQKGYKEFSVWFRVYLHSAFTMSDLRAVRRAPKKQEESKEQMLSNPSANVFLDNFGLWGIRNPHTIHDKAQHRPLLSWTLFLT